MVTIIIIIIIIITTAAIIAIISAVLLFSVGDMFALPTLQKGTSTPHPVLPHWLVCPTLPRLMWPLKWNTHPQMMLYLDQGVSLHLQVAVDYLL
jgi:hypothetical protein